MSTSIVVAGGGTAGHVYPGLALAAAIRAMDADADVAFVGTERGIEKTAVPEAGFPLEMVDMLPFSAGAARVLAPLSAVRATRQAVTILRKRGARAVVGMGGYASLPVAFAAGLLRLPLVLHEQNAVPGLANVLASRLSKRVAVTFPDAVGAFPRRSHPRVLGNPLRREIVTIDRAGLRAQAVRFFGLQRGRRTVVVTGGSLGAARLNAAAIELAGLWADRADVQILLSAGPKNTASAREACARLPGIVVVDFIRRMELAYAAADVAVCRAGASSVTELACTGLPSILVPYPFARRSHQDANARALEREGGAVVLADEQTSGARLASMLDPMLGDSARLASMAQGALRFARPRAAEDLAAWVLDAAAGR